MITILSSTPNIYCPLFSAVMKRNPVIFEWFIWCSNHLGHQPDSPSPRKHCIVLAVAKWPATASPIRSYRSVYDTCSLFGVIVSTCTAARFHPWINIAGSLAGCAILRRIDVALCDKQGKPLTLFVWWNPWPVKGLRLAVLYQEVQHQSCLGSKLIMENALVPIFTG